LADGVIQKTPPDVTYSVANRDGRSLSNKRKWSVLGKGDMNQQESTDKTNKKF
jgi:hypothetical protein